MRIAKTKALISFAVTAKLICVFVFAYAKCRFSHDAAQKLGQRHFNPAPRIVTDTMKVYRICRKVVKSLGIRCQVHAAEIFLIYVLDKSTFIFFNNFGIVLKCTNISHILTIKY